MNYGPFLSATLEVDPGNIANKGIAIRLDPGAGGIARGQHFALFETDTLRWAAAWSSKDFIDWKNIAFTGQHEVHAHIAAPPAVANPDAPGWANPSGSFEDQRLTGLDNHRYGPIPRAWGHWKGLYLNRDQVVLSYTIHDSDVLECAGDESTAGNAIFTRTIEVGPRSRNLILQVAHRAGRPPELRQLPQQQSAAAQFALFPKDPVHDALAISIKSDGTLKWLPTREGDLRLQIPAGPQRLRFKLLFCEVQGENPAATVQRIVRASAPPTDLAVNAHGGPVHWPETFTTQTALIRGGAGPYQIDEIALPKDNPYHSWMRLGGFDFFPGGNRAAVCTWQGDVWIVAGLTERSDTVRWRRIAAGLFQPLGLKIVDGMIYVTCRDQITRLRDLNGDGETDYYENFNNDAQVTEHFHEFAMDLQTDADGNFYYAKAARHAKEALVPQHGTLLKVSRDGGTTEIIASGFRAPNGVCVNGDGTFIMSDQEGHWTPENRINWVRRGKFYGNMMAYHEPGRSPNDFEPPVLWIHRSFDRSPAEQLWVTSDQWGPLKGALLNLSYGTGDIHEILFEKEGSRIQGGIVRLPIPELPTGIIRGRFNPGDGQLYVCGLVGWASDRTAPGGFYRIRYTGKPVHVPIEMRVYQRGIQLTFTNPLDEKTAADVEAYSIHVWGYRRTANYGSPDVKLSDPNQLGRDSLEVTGAALSSDKKSVFLSIKGLAPATQMEIKYLINAADGAELSQTLENTIYFLRPDPAPAGAKP